MSLSAQVERDSHRLHFTDFPSADFDYQENRPEEASSVVHLQVVDTRTEKILSIFLKATDLQNHGISLTAWKAMKDNPVKLSELLQNASKIKHLLDTALPIVSKHLTPKYLDFFKDISFANRAICLGLEHGRKRISKVDKVPGMYFHADSDRMNLFIHLKKTPPLGEGSFAKIRTALWLTAPNKELKIVAKKTITKNNLRFSVGRRNSELKQEINALETFSEQKGIISMISGGCYEEKLAIFLPLYECNLAEYINQPSFTLSLHEQLKMISQWIEGLATIFKQGIHRDIKPENLLIRRGRQGVEAVICDFSSYRSFDQKSSDISTPVIRPPESYTEKTTTLTYDVWGMGLCLHAIFSEKQLPCWTASSIKELSSWVSPLTSNWILQYPFRSDTPPFMLRLINEMLEPNPNLRLDPEAVFRRFSIEYVSFLTEKSISINHAGND